MFFTCGCAVAFARRATRTGGKHILNSKRGPKNFYKGKGAKKLGRLGTKAGFMYGYYILHTLASLWIDLMR